MLKKSHRQKADRTTSCLNEHLAGKRGEHRAAKHARRPSRQDSKPFFSKERIFEEEKLRLEKLKAQLAAEPAVPKADDMDTDLETAESLTEKELVLRRMAPAKVDDDGTSLSAHASAQKSRNKQTASQQC